MEKIFLKNKEIFVKNLGKTDGKTAKKFKDFINSLIKEKAQILEKTKKTEKQAKEYLKNKTKEVGQKKTIFLLCFDRNKIVAKAEIYLLPESQNHIGILRIAVRKEYRNIGLGSCLMGKILKLAKTQLKPRPKIIRLSVFETNKKILSFYQKFGFKKTAVIPQQYHFGGKFVDDIIMFKYV